MERLRLSFLALVVTAFARWLLGLFVFFPGGGESSLSDLIFVGDGENEDEEHFFCLFLLGEDLAFLRLDGLRLL